MRQNRWSCMCIRAGPVAIFAFGGADETRIRYWMSSPRLCAIFTCHCIKRSRVSNASTTVTSWQMIAIVFDSLSSVNPDSTPRNCWRDSDAFVCPCLYRSFESLYSCRWRQSRSREIQKKFIKKLNHWQAFEICSNWNSAFAFSWPLQEVGIAQSKRD